MNIDFYNPIVAKQLQQIEKADLSNFDASTSTFFIKKRIDIKLEVNKNYLIHVKSQFFTNEVIHANWNHLGEYPVSEYLQIQVNQIAGKMTRLTGISYDIDKNQVTGNLWSGWIPIADIEIMQKL